MPACVVPLCDTRDKSTSFHTFPADKELRRKWVLAISRQGRKPGTLWSPSVHSRICSKHFKESDFSVSTTRRSLLPRVIPSIFPYKPKYIHMVHDSKDTPSPENRPKRMKGRNYEAAKINTYTKNKYSDNGIEEFLCDDPPYENPIDGGVISLDKHHTNASQVPKAIPLLRPIVRPKIITIPKTGTIPKLVTLPRVITLGANNNSSNSEVSLLDKYGDIIKKLIRRSNKQGQIISALSCRIKILELKLKRKKRNKLR